MSFLYTSGHLCGKCVSISLQTLHTLNICIIIIINIIIKNI